MNRLGMMIDVSHPSKESMKQMIALSKAPIIASYSTARALCDHSRNLDNEQLQWMKQNEGVGQTVAFQASINSEKNNARNKAVKTIKETVALSLGPNWYGRESMKKLTEVEKALFYDLRGEIMKVADDQVQAI